MREPTEDSKWERARAAVATRTPHHRLSRGSSFVDDGVHGTTLGDASAGVIALASLPAAVALPGSALDGADGVGYGVSWTPPCEASTLCSGDGMTTSGDDISRRLGGRPALAMLSEPEA